MSKERALYFGCIGRAGHYLHLGQWKTAYDSSDVPCFPWSMGLMDSGLLKNGKRPDVYDGKVFWTCGGRAKFWFAFFWWDNSVDKRPGSNSGFYVPGFEWPLAEDAFASACADWAEVVKRQHQPLILQNPPYMAWPRP